MTNIAIILLSFLIGSIPSAYIFTRVLNKQDIRTVGTGNVGTMNTLRYVGVKPGLYTFLTDFLKGIVIVLIAKYSPTAYLPIYALLGGILGHNHSPFIGFKGGKGFATLMGGLILISPITLGSLLLIATILLKFTDNPRNAQGYAILMFPFVFLVHGFTMPYIIAGTLIALIIFNKHIPHIFPSNENEQTNLTN